MTLIENGAPIAQFNGSDVELWVPESIEDFLKQFLITEMLQGTRQPFAEGFVYMRLQLCSDKTIRLKSAMLEAMFMTDLINLN